MPYVTPLSKDQVHELLDVATQLGEKKHLEVSDGIDNQVVHADNYSATLASLKRRVKDGT